MTAPFPTKQFNRMLDNAVRDPAYDFLKSEHTRLMSDFDTSEVRARAIILGSKSNG